MHENHIGWDSKNNCFDFSQLSKETKQMFKNAGIRKKDLRDKDTALMIYSTLLNQNSNSGPIKKGKGKQKQVKAAKTREKKDKNQAAAKNDPGIPDLGIQSSQTSIPTVNMISSNAEILKPPTLNLAMNMNLTKPNTSVTKDEKTTVIMKIIVHEGFINVFGLETFKYDSAAEAAATS